MMRPAASPKSIRVEETREDSWGAIRRGQMKEMSPEKHTNMQVCPATFKSWAKDVKDHLFWHDRSNQGSHRVHCQQLDHGPDVVVRRVREMLLHFEVWTLKLTPRCTWEIGAFLETESKMLAATAEVNNPQSLKMHKSGLQLWNS